jgi:hypothetical protein
MLLKRVATCTEQFHSLVYQFTHSMATTTTTSAFAFWVQESRSEINLVCWCGCLWVVDETIVMREISAEHFAIGIHNFCVHYSVFSTFICCSLIVIRYLRTPCYTWSWICQGSKQRSFVSLFFSPFRNHLAYLTHWHLKHPPYYCRYLEFG